MDNIKKAVFLSVGEKYIVFVIQFVSSIVLARILTPEEIGIFSIGSLVLQFSHALRDLGISNYIIQERDLSPARLQTAATITCLMSWVLALLTLALSGPVAAFYRDDGVGQVLIVLSLNFFFLPLGSVSIALLKRRMNFNRLIRINLASCIAHAAVAIGLCWYGVGFIGLAWAGVAGTLVTVVLTLLMTKREVSLRPELREWRHVLQTGGRFCGSALLWEVGLGAPELIVGKTMNIESAGFLARAQGVVGLAFRSLMEGLTPVLLPFFAKSHRAGEDVRENFLKSICYLSALTFPVFACLAMAMDSIVLLLYGEQWISTIQPARILCLGMAALTIAVTVGAVVSGTGETKYTLRFQLVGQPIKIGFILAGSFYSLNHVAGGIAAGDIVMTTYSMWVLRRLQDFRFRQFVSALAPSVLVAICASATCLAFKMLFPEAKPFLAVMGCMLFSLLGWLGGLFLTRHPFGKEIGTLALKFARR